MTDFIESLQLWPAQDALLAALALEDDLDDVAQGIGFPVNVEPAHVWIAGKAQGLLGDELSGEAPSAETFHLTAIVYVRLADEYLEVRNVVRTIAAAVMRAFDSDTFRAVVPAWTLSAYDLEESTDGTYRELALLLDVECRCW